MRKLLLLLVIVSSSIMLSGCLGTIMYLVCVYTPGENEDHCFQAAAVQEAEPEGCEKIKGAKFNALQGNPPRDKCYMMIAVETCNPTVCDQIKGGFISYTPEGCKEQVALAVKEGKCAASESSTGSSQSSESSSSEGERECTFDSDCGAVCEGSVLRKRGCTSAYKCELLREKVDCAQEAEVVVTSEQRYSFPHTCGGTGKETACVQNNGAIQELLQAEYDSLRKEFNDLQAGADDLRALYQKADKICLSVLSDVTNKLIIDTALALKSPPTKMMSVVTKQTAAFIDKMGKLVLSNGKPAPSMPASPEEKIALWCNLTNEISRTEIPLLEKKRDKIMKDLKILKAALDDAK